MITEDASGRAEDEVSDSSSPSLDLVPICGEVTEGRDPPSAYHANPVHIVGRRRRSAPKLHAPHQKRSAVAVPVNSKTDRKADDSSTEGRAAWHPRTSNPPDRGKNPGGIKAQMSMNSRAQSSIKPLVSDHPSQFPTRHQAGRKVRGTPMFSQGAIRRKAQVSSLSRIAWRGSAAPSKANSLETPEADSPQQSKTYVTLTPTYSASSKLSSATCTNIAGISTQYNTPLPNTGLRYRDAAQDTHQVPSTATNSTEPIQNQGAHRTDSTMSLASAHDTASSSVITLSTASELDSAAQSASFKLESSIQAVNTASASTPGLPSPTLISNSIASPPASSPSVSDTPFNPSGKKSGHEAETFRTRRAKLERSLKVDQERTRKITSQNSAKKEAEPQMAPHFLNMGKQPTMLETYLNTIAPPSTDHPSGTTAIASATSPPAPSLTATHPDTTANATTSSSTLGVSDFRASPLTKNMAGMASSVTVPGGLSRVRKHKVPRSLMNLFSFNVSSIGLPQNTWFKHSRPKRGPALQALVMRDGNQVSKRLLLTLDGQRIVPRKKTQALQRLSATEIEGHALRKGSAREETTVGPQRLEDSVDSKEALTVRSVKKRNRSSRSPPRYGGDESDEFAEKHSETPSLEDSSESKNMVSTMTNGGTASNNRRTRQRIVEGKTDGSRGQLSLKKCKCGSSEHRRATHRSCPLNPKNRKKKKKQRKGRGVNNGVVGHSMRRNSRISARRRGEQHSIDPREICRYGSRQQKNLKCNLFPLHTRRRSRRGIADRREAPLILRKKPKKPKKPCRCGSTEHQRPTHKSCPLYGHKVFGNASANSGAESAAALPEDSTFDAESQATKESNSCAGSSLRKETQTKVELKGPLKLETFRARSLESDVAEGVRVAIPEEGVEKTAMGVLETVDRKLVGGAETQAEAHGAGPEAKLGGAESEAGVGEAAEDEAVETAEAELRESKVGEGEAGVGEAEAEVRDADALAKIEEPNAKGGEAETEGGEAGPAEADTVAKMGETESEANLREAAEAKIREAEAQIREAEAKFEAETEEKGKEVDTGSTSRQTRSAHIALGYSLKACKCGSTEHMRTNHRSCPLFKGVSRHKRYKTNRRNNDVQEPANCSHTDLLTSSPPPTLPSESSAEISTETRPNEEIESKVAFGESETTKTCEFKSSENGSESPAENSEESGTCGNNEDSDRGRMQKTCVMEENDDPDPIGLSSASTPMRESSSCALNGNVEAKRDEDASNFSSLKTEDVKRRACRCGSTDHKRPNHRSCPLFKGGRKAKLSRARSVNLTSPKVSQQTSTSKLMTNNRPKERRSLAESSLQHPEEVENETASSINVTSHRGDQSKKKNGGKTSADCRKEDNDGAEGGRDYKSRNSTSFASLTLKSSTSKKSNDGDIDANRVLLFDDDVKEALPLQRMDSTTTEIHSASTTHSKKDKGLTIPPNPTPESPTKHCETKKDLVSSKTGARASEENVEGHPSALPSQKETMELSSATLNKPSTLECNANQLEMASANDSIPLNQKLSHEPESSNSTSDEEPRTNNIQGPSNCDSVQEISRRAENESIREERGGSPGGQADTSRKHTASIRSHDFSSAPEAATSTAGSSTSLSMSPTDGIRAEKKMSSIATARRNHGIASRPSTSRSRPAISVPASSSSLTSVASSISRDFPEGLGMRFFDPKFLPVLPFPPSTLPSALRPSSSPSPSQSSSSSSPSLSSSSILKSAPSSSSTQRQEPGSAPVTRTVSIAKKAQNASDKIAMQTNIVETKSSASTGSAKSQINESNPQTSIESKQTSINRGTKRKWNRARRASFGAFESWTSPSKLSKLPEVPEELRKELYRYDESQRLLTADFRNSELTEKDLNFIRRCFELDDITTVVKGAGKRLSAHLWTLDYLTGRMGSMMYHKFRRYVQLDNCPLDSKDGDDGAQNTSFDTLQLLEETKEPSIRPVRFQEHDWVNMTFADYRKYLEVLAEAQKERAEWQAKLGSSKQSRRFVPKPRILRVRDCVGREQDIDANRELIYLLDLPIPSCMPELQTDLKRGLPFDTLPGGEHCMLKYVSEHGRPHMGPNVYLSPAGPYTWFHQDGHGTVDSGHLCVQGKNEVIMLRNLNQRNKTLVIDFLKGNRDYDLKRLPHDSAEDGKKVPVWPTAVQIQKLKDIGASPSQFVLEPGDYVHINRGRLHAFRKLGQCAKNDSGAAFPDMCLSVAWDWIFECQTSRLVTKEVQKAIENGRHNSSTGQSSLGIIKTASLKAAQALSASINALPDTCLQSGYRRQIDILKGLRPIIKEMARSHSKAAKQVESLKSCEESESQSKRRKRIAGFEVPRPAKITSRTVAAVEQAAEDLADKETEAQFDCDLAIAKYRNVIGSETIVDTSVPPEVRTVDPHGIEGFQCKVCRGELYNMYMHCLGCERLLQQDWNICDKCYEGSRFRVNEGKTTYHGHRGNVKETAGECSCRQVSCAQCGNCIRCGCTCHTDFQLRFRFMSPNELNDLAKQVDELIKHIGAQARARGLRRAIAARAKKSRAMQKPKRHDPGSPPQI